MSLVAELTGTLPHLLSCDRWGLKPTEPFSWVSRGILFCSSITRKWCIWWSRPSREWRQTVLSFGLYLVLTQSFYQLPLLSNMFSSFNSKKKSVWAADVPTHQSSCICRAAQGHSRITQTNVLSPAPPCRGRLHRHVFWYSTQGKSEITPVMSDSRSSIWRQFYSYHPRFCVTERYQPAHL